VKPGAKYHVSAKVCGSVEDDVHVDIRQDGPNLYLLRQLGIETSKPEPELSTEMQAIKEAAEQAAYEYDREPTYRMPSVGRYKDGSLNFGAVSVDELHPGPKYRTAPGVDQPQQVEEEDEDEEVTLRIDRARIGCCITLSNDVIIF
jgi:hypothetical protein